VEKEVTFRKKLERPKVKSWLKLLHTYQNVYALLDSRLSKMGCTVSRFQILFNLYFKGALKPIQMARILNVSRANITTFVKRLTADGLIEADIQAGTEKRPAYRLTTKGTAYFEDIFPHHIAEVEKNLLPFTDEFVSLLDNIYQISSKNREEGA
jgi:DNA-binding MarR family transcriptional regulator